MRYLILAVVCGIAVTLLALRGVSEPPPFAFTAGPINSVVIARGGAKLAVYGHPAETQCERVLLTHHRRDVVSAARKLIDAGARATAPADERAHFETPEEHWATFAKSRFHDYAQQSTKILDRSLPVAEWVKEEASKKDEIASVVKWQGLEFRVLDTPGFTRGAVSYVVDLDGKRIAFTGDLIYGNGQLFDLYSLQDAIPEAKIGGYHGYASRLAKLIPSLKKVAALKPDMIVPARGPIISNPQEAIDRLIARVQSIYRNYLSTNALNWYFKEERMTISGKRVLGPDAEVQLMDYSHHEKAPEWVWDLATSRMLISDQGNGFLLDCGYQRVIDAVKKLIADGRIKKVDGIFATHCHDDHTDFIQRAAEEFQCPVYALQEYKDVLENPDGYRLPALTPNAIKDVRGMKHGEKLTWDEFQLTFHYYPGQMLHHGALLAEKSGQRPIFFIGDSFSPSGMDDYCLLNRNLVHENHGYFACLKRLREFPGDYWLINEHIPFVFTFSDKELDYLESRYRERLQTLRGLFPWDDPNYGIDEQWAVFYPYGSTAAAGSEVDLEVRLLNHSPGRRTFAVTPHLPPGVELVKSDRSVTLASRESGRVRLKVRTAAPGDYLVTADIDSEGMAFREWVEATVAVR